MSKATESRGKYLNMLIYGPHGAGKTTLLGSAADVESMNDILLVTAEGGSIVFEDNDRIDHIDGIAMIKIDRIEQFQKVYEWVKFHCDARDRGDDKKLKELQDMIGLIHPDGEDGIFRFHTVIVDSLSEIEAYNLSKILNLDALGLDAGDDMEVAGFPQFRKNMHIMQRIVRQFRDLPIHCLMTCAQAYSQDERKAFHYGPKLTGQLTGIIQGFFDIVGWLVPNSQDVDPKTGVARRRLFVQPQTAPKADAKCRLASFKSDFFDNPVMADIMQQTGFTKK
ncbi:AAA family ATPase [Parvimonas sp. M13]|nr:AAA family ATPase [Parvimonas sp. M13]